MAQHGRRKSTGSHSIFSLEAMRSMSRTGIRPAQQLPTDNRSTERLDDQTDDRNETSDTGQRDHQLSPNATPHAEEAPRPTHAASGILSSLFQRSMSVRENRRPGDHATRALQRFRSRRPISWLPVALESDAGPGRSPDNENAAGSRTMISDPVLTSTTNVEVARSEGVVYDQTADFNFVDAAHADVEGIPKCRQADEDEVTQSQHSPLIQLSQSSELREGSGPASKKLSLGGRMNSVSKMTERVATGLRKAGHHHNVSSLFKKDSFKRLAEWKPVKSADGEVLAANRASIRGLGRGTLRLFQRDKQVQSHATGESEIEDRYHGSEDGTTTLLETSVVCESTDQEAQSRHPTFSFGDLESSFAQAVENLDQSSQGQQVGGQSLLHQSSQSHLVQHKSAGSTSQVGLDRNLRPREYALTPSDPNTVRSARHTPMLSHAASRTSLLSLQPSSSLLRKEKRTHGDNNSSLRVRARNPSSPQHTSTIPSPSRDTAAHLKSENRPARPHRHLSSLNSHPNTMEFAKKPERANERPGFL